MKKLFGVVTAVLLCACSSGERVGSQTAVAAEASAPESAAAAARAGQGGAGDFADLPDRGDLVAYERSVVRRRGAYTWHAAELSETHAVNAIVTGEMTVTAPDGTPITLRYDRHIEHPDGNWSWVGSTADGEQALITFGAEAAFGSIPRGDGRLPLRLTTTNGSPWVVSTDPRQLAAMGIEATDPSEPDYLIPPKLGVGSASTPAGKTAAGAAPVATGVGTVRVDLLVGYTQGFAAAHGGESGARTRIYNLVDLTNQAYLNSQIDAEVRLVHSMQVNYPDATDNGGALEGLTGFRAPSTQIEPDPAFSGLRSAREQYGADLVTLIRKFQTPENDSCGIAWLNGGGKSGISQNDEFFGYSVVSDGHDAGTDGNYFCRDATLAHELGHNMGSQHDAGTANNEPGLYDFSYGYKTAGGNFYTIMAYGDDGQTEYNVFSNPDITFCGGSRCGVADQADNARSLRLALPVVASFREAKSQEAVVFDFDGDGYSDMFWHNIVGGDSSLWPSASRAARRYLSQVYPVWQVAGVGDFDGDGIADILWRNQGTGDNTIWPSGQPSGKRHLEPVTAAGWKVGPIADFTGDGRADILWINPDNGQNAIWPSGNRSDKQTVATIRNTDWKVVAGADFDADGKADMLLRNFRDGRNLIWYSANSATWRLLEPVSHLEWKVTGTGDFNNDGFADILWHRDSTGESSIWPSADRGRKQSVSTLRDPTWRVGAVGDYNGDGAGDVVWRNPGTGANVVWYSVNRDTYEVLASVKSDDWQLVHFP